VFSPEGQMLASGGQDQAVIVWPIPGGRPLKRFDEPLGPVAALAFHPRGQMVVSLSREFVQVGLLTRHELESRKIPCRAATCLAVAPEKAQAATAGQDGRVCVWDLLDGELLRELDGAAPPVQALAYRADGEALAATGRGGRVHVWERRGGTGKALSAASVPWAWPGVEPAPVGRKRAPLAGAWRLPDGRLLAARAHGPQVRLWTPSDGRPFAALEGHTGAVLCLASSRDGTLLASGGKDHTIRLWRPTAPAAVLAQAPVGEMSLDDWDWVRTRLAEPGLSPPERQSLLFLDALMRHRWRSDVHVEEAAPRCAGGAYDITVEG
jgi:WD40 repeat protein